MNPTIQEGSGGKWLMIVPWVSPPLQKKTHHAIVCSSVLKDQVMAHND